MLEEIDSVAGDRELTYSDYHDLVYCRAVFRESLRMYAPIPNIVKVLI